MRRITAFLLFLLILLTGYAQNPFAAYGYEPTMATLSNGRFDEFHDKNRIVEIGSIKFDTKTNKIVGLVGADTLDSVMDVQTVSRFISIDPHAERYYSISPYAYCNNNPVNYVDPDGRDWYRHNENGSYYWQEGHDELEGYTNVGSSVSIQLGDDSYFNAYQNTGVMANQAVNAFGLISSSAKLQNQFLGKNSPLSENSKSELFNGLVNQETNEIGLKVGQALWGLTASEFVGGVGGRFLSKLFNKFAADAIQTTAHGAERIAGAAATRGGVLTANGIRATKTMGKAFSQSDGATVYLHEISSGRFNAVVLNADGKVITTMSNWSQKSINRIAKNYGWNL